MLYVYYALEIPQLLTVNVFLCRTDVSFEIRNDANPPSRQSKLVRFPGNPEPNWGPKARAKRRYLEFNVMCRGCAHY